MESSPLTEIGLPIALAIIMIGIGLTLTKDDFRRELAAPKGLIVGSLGQILLIPALGFVLISLIDLEPAIAVGLVIVAACPGGTTSNLVSFLARANVALSIVLTVVASVVTIVTLPLFTGFALDLVSAGADEAVGVPLARTVATLIAVVLLPVGIGMAIRARAPHRAAAVEKGVSAFGAVILVALIIGIALSVDDIGRLLAQAGPVVVLLNLGGIAIGWLTGRASGLSGLDRLTLAIELGVKNSTLGILLAELLAGLDYAVPAAVYGLLMYASAAVLVVIGRRRVDPDHPAGVAPSGSAR